MCTQIAENETKAQTFWENLLSYNRGFESQTALICGRREMPYGELFGAVSQAAKGLSRAGVREGNIIPVFSLSTPETVAAFYALNQIGAISDWIDIKTTDKEIRRRLEEAGTRLVVVLELCLPQILRCLEGTAVEKIVVLPLRPYLPKEVNQAIFQKHNHVTGLPDRRVIWWKEVVCSKETEEGVEAPFEAGKPAVIAYTGGTTGNPKGVLLSNESINTLIRQYRIRLPHVKRGQRALNLLPPFAMYGLCASIHLSLCLGLTTTMIPLFRPRDFGECLLREKPDHVNGTTSFWEALLQSEEAKNGDFSFLESPGTGGDGMTAELEQEINHFLAEHHASCRLIKGYGMTEVCATACLCTPESNELGSVGLPMPGNKIRIQDPETGLELPTGQVGEILIHSPAVMLGYLNNEKETRELLRKDHGGKLWVYTKDLGYVKSNGALFVVGRLKRMFTRSGFKIYPSIIENLLAGHSAVQSCAVVGIPGLQGETTPRAYVVVRKDFIGCESSLRKELLDLCRSNLNRFEVPEEVRFLQEIPKTNLEKVDYQSLEQEG